MTLQNRPDAFDAFWNASKLSSHEMPEFSSNQERFNGNDKMVSLLEYPAQPISLPKPKSLANILAKRRASKRSFGPKSLSTRELSLLLSSFAAVNGVEHRSYPSAGASYAIEIFCVALNVEKFSGKILYYNADEHGVSVIGDAPSWSELAPNINVSVDGVPQCVFIFTMFHERLTDKYLERGGRFALLEAGAAMQQLAIQIASTRKLKGVAAGGLIDDYWSALLGFKKSEIQVALGYLCGK